MSRIGIIAAFPGELRPLVRRWGRQPLPGGGKGDAAWLGSIGPNECMAVAGGMGQRAAARACHAAESLAGSLDALVSFGWAGALSCGIQAGRAYSVAEVIDGGTGERFPAGLPGSAGLPGRQEIPLTLVTIDHVAERQEKRRLGEKHRAVLVDMEGAAVARVAMNKGIAFYCIKGVTDEANEVLPDFSRFAGPYGRIRIARLLAYVGVRPKYWRGMARMGKNSRMGAVAMARAIENALQLPGGESDADHNPD